MFKFKKSIFIALVFFSRIPGSAQAQEMKFFQEPYNAAYENSMEELMKEGIDNFLTRHTEKVILEREKFWNRNFDSRMAYEESIAPNRQQLREIIGAVDRRNAPNMLTIGYPGKGDQVGETNFCTIHQVVWEVMGGLKAEGLMLLPKGEIKASIIVIPDADESPESYSGLATGSGLALRLAEAGARVIVPVLVNRDTRYAGSDALIPSNPWLEKEDSASVWTNQTHREWIHRQGYIMGRHIIGMEVQKILAAVDWFSQNTDTESVGKIGVMGYGEGGLLALYSAALDDRIDATWVSGYFGPREELWREPIYRNIWSLLTAFGDAEIASMIAPRSLIIEASPVPEVNEPPVPKEGQRPFGLPGILETPSAAEVKGEYNRLVGFFEKSGQIKPEFSLVPNVEQYGSPPALAIFSKHLTLEVPPVKINAIKNQSENSEIQERQYRVFDNMVEYIQDMIPTSDRTRYAFLKGDFTSPESWDKDMEPYRKLFYEELVGDLKQPLLPMNPKMRLVYDEPGWKGYEVILDVWPGVFSWGILAVPNDIKPGEIRPSVVIQHGIRGLPSSSISGKTYYSVLPALANRGFVVFSPHNPYQFNIRKANPIKAGAFSVIIPQHQQILNFLKSLDYVDPTRIALYGKSWGGRTAQRVPIVLKDYSTVISSAYFNDWVRKIVSTDFRNSYFFENSLSIYEWNMGNTFTHAEMALLIAPRPFMVESGYLDGVAAHEMVAYEYAKVKRIYDHMEISDRIDLEFFMGGHVINGKGTFRFLHKHLDWPEPEFPTAAQEISK